MEIKTRDYLENKQIIIKQLDEYTVETVPELSQYEFKPISLVCEEDGQIFGRIVGEIHWHYLRIELFYVDGKIRGKGVGSRLLSEIEQIAEKEQCSLVFLETMSFNAPAFYLHHGYEIIGQIDHHPLEDETHYFMCKRLKG